MFPWDKNNDWLVKQLSERCKEKAFVDEADLSIILSLNIADYVAPDAYGYHGVSYGQAIQELGRAVAAKAGKLVVPALDDYSRTEVLQAPPDWLALWHSDETIPSAHTLSAQFDIFSARTPEGGPMVIDGPGSSSFEAFQQYQNERMAVLERRRLRRLAGGK